MAIVNGIGSILMAIINGIVTIFDVVRFSSSTKTPRYRSRDGMGCTYVCERLYVCVLMSCSPPRQIIGCITCQGCRGRGGGMRSHRHTTSTI